MSLANNVDTHVVIYYQKYLTACVSRDNVGFLMKDTEHHLGTRTGAGASTRRGNQARPLRQPRGLENPAPAGGNPPIGRLTASGDYDIQIMLATWALRELSAQRRLQPRRGGSRS
jgi:hypothetical protein